MSPPPPASEKRIRRRSRSSSNDVDSLHEGKSPLEGFLSNLLADKHQETRKPRKQNSVNSSRKSSKERGEKKTKQGQRLKQKVSLEEALSKPRNEESQRESSSHTATTVSTSLTSLFTNAGTISPNTQSNRSLGSSRTSILTSSRSLSRWETGSPINESESGDFEEEDLYHSKPPAIITDTAAPSVAAAKGRKPQHKKHSKGAPPPPPPSQSEYPFDSSYSSVEEFLTPPSRKKSLFAPSKRDTNDNRRVRSIPGTDLESNEEALHVREARGLATIPPPPDDSRSVDSTELESMSRGRRYSTGKTPKLSNRKTLEEDFEEEDKSAHRAMQVAGRASRNIIADNASSSPQRCTIRQRSLPIGATPANLQPASPASHARSLDRRHLRSPITRSSSSYASSPSTPVSLRIHRDTLMDSGGNLASALHRLSITGNRDTFSTSGTNRSSRSILNSTHNRSISSHLTLGSAFSEFSNRTSRSTHTAATNNSSHVSLASYRESAGRMDLPMSSPCSSPILSPQNSEHSLEASFSSDDDDLGAQDFTRYSFQDEVPEDASICSESEHQDL